MASSNRHWPSLFKSKPCNQPWHDISTPPPLSSTCQKSPYTSAGCEERTPEPKPRWNPKPEQIRILEAIFNSGMVNPPREEIRKIRIQLQQYGQVGDANVFYWFQNRKSRTKSKHRHLLSSRANSRPTTGATANAGIATTSIATPHIGILTNGNSSSNSNSMTPPSTNVTVPVTMTTLTSSSSSSSEGSSGSSKPVKPVHVPMSVPEPINMYNNFHGSMELSCFPEPFFFQNPHGYCFAIPELAGLITAPEQVTSVGLGLWNEAMGNNGAATGEEVGTKRKNNADELHRGLGLTNELVNHEGYKGFFARDNGGEDVKIGLQQNCCFQPTATTVVASTAATGVADITCAGTTVVSCPVNVLQDNNNGEGGGGGGGGGAGRLTVFINDTACEVSAEPLNVKSVFGPNVILFQYPSGFPVPTDEFHNTLQPLQHGGFYYVIPV